MNVPKLRFKGFEGEWEKAFLKDVIDVKSGKDYKHLDKGDIPVYGTGGYMLSVNDFLSAENAIGIGRKGSIDKPQKLMAPFWTVDTLFYCLPRKNNTYLFLFTLFQKIRWKKYDESTGVPSLSKNTIEKIKVFLPSMSEQQKIGLFFEKLERKIQLQQEKIDLLQKQKKGFLQKMFPKAGETQPELRFKGFEEEWKISKVGDLMNVTSVKRIHQSDWREKGVRFLRARDIVSMFKNIEIEEHLYISQERYEEFSKISGKVEKGDLLVTGVGTIGVPLLIENDEALYFKDGNVIWFQNKNYVDGYFLYYSFINSNIQNFIHSVAGIGTVATYTIDNGRKTPICLPNHDEQYMIGNLLKQVDRRIILQQKKLKLLKLQKQGFMQQMFI